VLIIIRFRILLTNGLVLLLLLLLRTRNNLPLFFDISFLIKIYKKKKKKRQLILFTCRVGCFGEGYLYSSRSVSGMLMTFFLYPNHKSDKSYAKNDSVDTHLLMYKSRFMLKTL